jgi:hypothetical protein
MVNLEARIRIAAESIIENEALRDGLYDEEAASALLNWGVSQAESLARQTADIQDDEEADQAVYPRMRALRGMMTALKDLTTAEGWPSDAIQQTLETLQEHARVLYGAQWKPPLDFEQKIRLVLQTDDSRARLNSLFGLLSDHTAAPQAPTLGDTAPSGHGSPKPDGFFAKLFRRLRGN